MNRDTPDASSSDDFPFLGPAVSPRRRDAGSPLRGEEELSGPFVRHARPVEAAEAAVPFEATVPFEAAEAPGEVPAAEPMEESLDDLPAADWPSDDFPWLLPAEPERTPVIFNQSVVQQPPASSAWENQVSPAADTSAVPWDGKAIVGSSAEDQASEGGEEFVAATDFVWDEEADALRDATGDTVEMEPEPLRASVDDEELPEAPRWAWEDVGTTALDEAVPGDEVRVDRWDADSEGIAIEEEAVIVGEGVEPVAAEVEVPAPQIEVEPSPALAVELDDEMAHAAEAMATSSPLEDVAARLERIARSLRSGNPMDAFEQGDPLQLLITGYALGYSEARKTKG